MKKTCRNLFPVAPRILTAGWLALVLLAGSLAPNQCSAQPPAQVDTPTRVMLGIRFTGETPVISYIKPNGPAFRAGLQAGDELFSVDRQYVLQSNDLLRNLSNKQPGDVVEVEVRRGDTYRLFELTVMKATRGSEQVAEDGSILPQPAEFGLIGQRLPEFLIPEWEGLPYGKDTIRIRDLQNKIVCILLFQTTCQFSRSDGMPMMARLYEKYRDDSEIQFLAIQNSLPQREENTLESAVQFCAEFNLPIPVGHDSSTDPTRTICKTLDAPGTPWIIVTDSSGIVRFSDIPENLVDLQMLEKLKRGETVEVTPAGTPENTESSAATSSDSNTERSPGGRVRAPGAMPPRSGPAGAG